MTHSALAALVRKLQDHVIYAMSQNSKELFHSNLLAWLIRRYPAVAEVLTDSAEPARVAREENHTDLTIRQGDRLTVVELKTFALPQLDQLERIAAKYQEDDPGLVLLTLTSPLWDETTWKVVSYSELAKRLRPVVPAVQIADEFVGATMAMWLDLIDRLCELSRLVGQPDLDEPVTLPFAVRRQLDGARLDAAVQKMRHQRLAAELRGRAVPASVGYWRKEGLTEWYTEAANGFWWGWQLQGDQFRLVMSVPKGHPGHGKDAKHKAARLDEARRHTEFFTFGPIEGAGQTGPKRIEFGDYSPDFVYRYVNVPGITLGQAAKLGIEYAKHAQRYAARHGG